VNQFLYPITLTEMNLEFGVDVIGPADVADYAWPSGCRCRYTDAGWAKARRRGFALLSFYDLLNAANPQNRRGPPVGEDI
jgi:hypothetical protein